jgi:predicted nucleotidyltransferase
MNNMDLICTELNVLTKIIVDSVPVEQIYLYGSYAYGTPHKDSDLDLYVILKNEAPMRELEAYDIIRLATYSKQTKPMDLLVHKKDTFLNRSTGIATIEKIVADQGIKLYG